MKLTSRARDRHLSAPLVGSGGKAWRFVYTFDNALPEVEF